MRITIDHTTRFRFAHPAEHGLLRVRLKPRTCAVQTVLDWSIDITGGSLDTEYEDHNANTVAILRFAPGTEAIAVTCRGLVDTIESHDGVIGAHSGALPLWIFERETRATRPGPGLRALAVEMARGGASGAAMLDQLARRLGALILPGPEAGDAETAFAAHAGSEAERAHAFLAVARLLGYPARCITGYMLAARADRAAAPAPVSTAHCWVEAHVAGTGWITFDPSRADDAAAAGGHAARPDHRYVRVAVGVDASDAALITSHALGGGACDMAVRLAVARAQDRGEAAAQ